MSYPDVDRVQIKEGIWRAVFSQRVRRIITASVTVLVVWQLLAVGFFPQRVLPSPLEVGRRLLLIMEIGGPRGNSALFHLQTSLVRVLIVTVIALAIAVVLGILMGINGFIEDAFNAVLPFWMTLPTVIVVLVTMVMFKFSELSVVTAVVFAATPYATLNTYEGTKDIDPSLLEMAHAFGAARTQIWRHIYIPNIMPHVFGTLRYIFSMCWKIVVLAEVFGMSEGLGSMFRFWYNENDPTALLAYMSLFMIVMFIIESGAFSQLEKRVFRWRE